jgi:phospholipid/cholesterol/gamma-HCH transport system permease protein
MPKAPSNIAAPDFAINSDGDKLALQGALDIHTLSEARRALTRELKSHKSRALELGGLSRLDSPGAMFLCGLRGKGMELTGVRAEHQSLLDLICALELKKPPQPRQMPRWRQLIIQLGKGAEDALLDTRDVIIFTGRTASTVFSMLRHPRSLSLPSISRHIADTGIYALPIVGLLAIMISIVIGYQGIAQLRPYGGEEFTINLVAVSVLREMAVLITAIMVAGRTGSAFAAEIGVMRSREEIDALDVMGLDPMMMLVLPRVFGLLIALPLLTVFADLMGLAGGAAIAQISLHISPLQYLDRVHTAVTNNDLIVGLVKAPVFAVAIGIIGCMHGLRVKGSAESVGQETTRAVVKAIFLVIVLDALFSILFEQMGI